MFSRALRDTIIYGFSGILSRGLLILQVPLFGRVLAPHDFGILDILLISINLLNLSVALEISQGVAIYSSEAKGQQAKAGFASTALWFTLGCYSLFLAIALAFTDQIAVMLLDSAEFAPLVQLFLFTAAGYGMLLLVQNQLRWLLRPARFFAVNLIYGALNLSLATYFVFALEKGVQGIILAQLLAAVIATCFAIFFGRDVFRFHFELDKLRRMLSFSLPLVPSSVAIFFFIYIDRIVLKEMLGLEEVGMYGVAYRIACLIGVLIVGINGALAPLIYNRWEQEDTPQHVARILRLYLGAAALVILGMGVFSRDLLILFGGRDYAEVHHLIPLLAASLMFANLYVFAPGLVLKKRSKTIAIISIASALLNLVLNICLISLLGLMGAAIATFISAFVAFVARWMLSQSHYVIPQSWRRAPLLLVALVLAVILSDFATGELIQELALKTLIFLSAAIFVAWLTIERGEWESISQRLRMKGILPLLK